MNIDHVDDIVNVNIIIGFQCMHYMNVNTDDIMYMYISFKLIPAF